MKMEKQLYNFELFCYIISCHYVLNTHLNIKLMSTMNKL